MLLIDPLDPVHFGRKHSEGELTKQQSSHKGNRPSTEQRVDAWLIENKQGKSGHSTSAYLTKALDSWLDPCQWNWQYSYQLKSVLFLRTQTKGAVRRTSWLSSASGRKCWLPSATCLAYSVDVSYVLLFRPAKCEGSSSWWRWLFGESLGKEMKFWKALKDIICIFIEFYWLGLVFERRFRCLKFQVLPSFLRLS